jgi:hypothetical protein
MVIQSAQVVCRRAGSATLIMGLIMGFASAAVSAAQPLIPGTGHKLAEVGDDFEDPSWAYRGRFPKVANRQDETIAANVPGGRSANGRWYEGMKRGQPDFIRRVNTPESGMPGSRGALALQSLQTGIPNRPSYRQQQDDFVADVAERFGKIPVRRSPSVVTRVWLPPVDQWENRTGCHFAFRLALETTPPRGGYTFASQKDEFDGTYWPGMLIDFRSKEGRGATGAEYDYGVIRIRATERGGEVQGRPITETGWWTLGMSVTPDGMVHYYAKPGVDDLTDEDHIASHYPYGYRALRLRTFFFNVCNGDDGKTWSTRFVIDDPSLYVLRRS